MRFLHFSTSDGPGGAGMAAGRLHSALRDAGHASRMLVRQRSSHQVPPGSLDSRHHLDDRQIQTVPTNLLVTQLRRLQKHVPLVRAPRASFTFNYDREPGIRWRRVLEAVSQPPDAICLHWVAEFLTSKTIRAIHNHFGCPMLWTVMDQEPVTGGCHYSFGCQGYEQRCGNCPLLARPSAMDRSRQVFLRKERYLSGLPITFVAPTSWVEQRIRQSALFGRHRIARIPLAIDTNVFCTGDRSAARDKLGLPRDRQVVFFGSSYLHEPRKGGACLIEALRRLSDAYSQAPQATAQNRQDRANGAHHVGGGDNVVLLVAGRNGDELKRQLPFPVYDLGFLSDEASLATAYRAADVFVCPSVEDAGPMMIPEAMLCGTPVVAFNTGGAPDLIVSGRTGYLARLGDAADLGYGLMQVLASPARAALGEAAAQAAHPLHEPRVVAERYATLVAELTDSNRPSVLTGRGTAA